MGFFDDVPVVNEVEDAAGTAATGAVDTFIADPGNALLGVNADNMGIFEENAAGMKVIQAGSLGLAGEHGLVTDLLMPGQGTPGNRGGSDPPSPGPADDNDDSGVPTQKLLLVGAAIVVLWMVMD